ncbi:hypothetical protein LEP1GSC088_1810 [Leptospira interrogans str. L1207]|nr:hypothetical protein LEP1GSC088_1810 [Leptospira interrogans str. L1207]
MTQEEMGDLVGPLSISIATRDAELKPHFARAFGVRISEDQSNGSEGNLRALFKGYRR